MKPKVLRDQMEEMPQRAQGAPRKYLRQRGLDIRAVNVYVNITMAHHLLIENDWRLEAVGGSRCEVMEFLRKDVVRRSQEESSHAVAAVRHFSRQGPPHHPKRFKKLKGSDQIYQLTAARHVRLLGFYHRERSHVFVFTNGFWKTDRKEVDRALRKAKRLMKEYYLEEGGS